MLTPKNLLILSAVLFSTGTYGVLARRNLLIMLLSIELMFNAVMLVIATMARMFADSGGHIFMLMIIAISAAEVAVGLSILIALFRMKRTTNPMDLTALRG
ncbi:MAG: NADH-quinone oxidoreductase subunit NuoK [Planctomycetota bacterium]